MKSRRITGEENMAVKKYHVSKDGTPRECGAQQSCPLGASEEEHFTANTIQEARQKAEEINESKYGDSATLKKEAPKKVRYSFVTEFKEKEKKFNADFEGIPTRFFNAQLASSDEKKNKMISKSAEIAKMMESPDFFKRIPDGPEKKLIIDTVVNYSTASNDLPTRLMTTVSAPSDNAMSDEDAIQIFKDAGAEDIVKLDERQAKSMSQSNRAWIMRHNGKQLVVGSSAKGQNFAQYRMRYGSGMPEGYKSSFYRTDLRTMAGGSRIKKKTGVDLVNNIMHEKDTLKRSFNNLEALSSLQESQQEGKNFTLQKKYIKEHSGSVATAWMDKKNPDETRKKMMKETVLNNHFRKVEIDNDVDPEEYKDFEQSYIDTMDKLPPMAEDRKPELRLRKLGKHRATGVFFPHKNTIAVDIRDSSSFIHEYGHYIDLTVKNNQSLNNEFTSVTKEYSSALKMPDGIGEGKREYYTTPTEVHSRAFEMYAHERLGINNRLLNPDKFNEFDYKPFKDNPELKEKTFAFFDKVFSK